MKVKNFIVKIRIIQMMTNNSIILKEAIKPLLISLIVALISFILISKTIGFIVIFITVFIAYIYRTTSLDPKRDDSEILSISDGTIDAIDYESEDILVYINVSILNSHTLRAPIDANMKVIKYSNGLNLNPNSLKATKLNESVSISFDDLKVDLLSGICNNSIKIENNSVIKGDAISTFINGIIKIKLNRKNIKLNINLGDKVVAGKTVIAFINQG
jgi:phosphatidylserine decarboxylase